MLSKEGEQYRAFFYFKVPALSVLLSNKTLFKMGIIQTRLRGGRWLLMLAFFMKLLLLCYYLYGCCRYRSLDLEANKVGGKI